MTRLLGWDNRFTNRMRVVGAVAAAIALMPSGAGAQVPSGRLPPSIGVASEPPPTDAERAAQCKELDATIAGLKADPVWISQPYSAAEVEDFVKIRTSLKCVSAEAPLRGTWRIVGRPAYSTGVPIKGTMTLATISEAEGRKLGLEEWGIASSRACRSGVYFYTGTITWDADSLYAKSFVYWTREPSTVLLCTSDAESTSAVGNFRDNHGHGGHMEWRGSSGHIIPERNDGPVQDITVTRGGG